MVGYSDCYSAHNMFKLIQFTDTRAIWFDSVDNVPGFVCRTVEHLDVLPSDIYLEYLCKENDLGSVSNNRILLCQISKEYHVPEIKLRPREKQNYYTNNKKSSKTVLR